MHNAFWHEIIDRRPVMVVNSSANNVVIGVNWQRVMIKISYQVTYMVPFTPGQSCIIMLVIMLRHAEHLWNLGGLICEIHAIYILPYDVQRGSLVTIQSDIQLADGCSSYPTSLAKLVRSLPVNTCDPG